MNDESNSDEPSVLVGATAGAIGGLAGAAIKQFCEAIVPPRPADREPPPGVLAAKLVLALGGRELSAERKGTISLAVHWIFSTFTSALYGVFVTRSAQARIPCGVGFGVALWVGLHEITLPLLGATPPLAKLPVSEQLNELTTHSLFGITVEFVRAAISSYSR